MRLPDLLRETAARHGERPAFTELRTGETLTWARLLAEAEAVARTLRGLGVERAQRVGLLATNGLPYVAAAFGILEAGGCLVPVAANLAGPEVGGVLRDMGVNAVLSGPGLDDRLPRAAKPDGEMASGTAAGFRFRWIDREATAPFGFENMDPAFLRFTSGTTAARKGVILSHEGTHARAAAASQVLTLGPEDVVLWVLPLAHHFAVTITSYVAAASHVLLSTDTLAPALLSALRETRASLFYASPYHFETLGGLASHRGRLEALRVALSTTAPLRPEAAARFEDLYGVPVGQAYGIIELGLPCINLRRDGLSVASVGRAVPGYRVEVFDEGGRALPPGVAGEVGVQGSGMFSGYYTPWRPIGECLRDGFFMTGDVGERDASGALFLKGRKKSVVIVAGMKAFPEEIEAALEQHPGVREARVIGRPHPRMGEVPVAEIVLADPSRPPAESDLRAHCGRLLSAYKVPVAFRVVESVPRTPGGKKLRH